MVKGKISMIKRKSKGGAVLFAVFIFFFLLYPYMSYASTWSEIEYAYAQAQLTYPNQYIYIERVSDTLYYLWRRDGANIFFQTNYKAYNLAGNSSVTPGNIGGDGDYQIMHILACDGSTSASDKQINNGTTLYRYDASYGENRDCNGGADRSEGWASGVNNFNITNYYGEVAECKYAGSQGSGDDCKAGDIMINAFPMDSNCQADYAVSVGGLTSYRYESTDGKCSCVPSGMNYEGRIGDGIGAECLFAVDSKIGDFWDKETNKDLFVNHEKFGYSVVKDSSTTTTINSDGSSTTKEVKEYSDGSKDIKETTAITDSSAGSTTTVIKEYYILPSGVQMGTSSSSTSSFGDGSSSSSTTSPAGATITTQSDSSGNIITTSTAASGIKTTSTTSGGITTTGVSSTGTGTGSGTDTGKSVWEEPPASYIPPSISSGDDTTFDNTTGIDVPDTQIDYDAMVSKINELLGNNPIMRAAQETRIELSGASCKITTGEVFLGKSVTIDFCDLGPYLNLFGAVFVGICAIRSVFMAMGVEI